VFEERERESETAIMAEPERRNAAPIAVVLIVLLVVLPCVYVLSIGPAWYLVNNHYGTWRPAFDSLYYPLFALCRHSDTFELIMVQYLNWWIDISFRPWS
jgi:hypothetical protein